MKTITMDFDDYEMEIEEARNAGFFEGYHHFAKQFRDPDFDVGDAYDCESQREMRETMRALHAKAHGREPCSE